MPHQCTECARVFDDGSKEMLSGCPDCGGNTFQYYSSAADATPEQPDEGATPPDRPGESTVARTVGNAATTVRDLVGSGGPGVDDDPTPAHEDAAQASARSELVSPEDLPAAATQPPTSRPTPVMDERTDPSDEPSSDADERPDLSELRAELNDQFESIKVVEPGQYELNLMSLYDREEYIIALREDGKYTIQVPERWGGD